MSKLSDRMRRASRTEARPVGFTTIATAPQPTMLVIAEVSGKDAKGVQADALLFPDDTPESALKAAAENGTPVGVRLSKGDRDRVAKLHAAGVDFVVLTEDCATSTLMEEDLSYVLEVDGEPTDTDLRALDALPLEALLAPPVDGSLTIRHSIGLRRFVAFARKPLMLPVSAGATAADLEALRELNVLLLLAPAAAAAGLRDAVAALPPRRRRREESAVGVPTTLFSRATLETHDHDEDDDEE
jgi:hypothetical protein